MTRAPGPHIFYPDKKHGLCAVCGSSPSAEIHNVSGIQANRVCFNCLMSKGKAHRLEWVNDAWECMTVGGCGSRSSEHYLDKVAPQAERMMIAFGIKKSDAITRDTKINERTLPELTGERRVILPEDDNGPTR